MRTSRLRRWRGLEFISRLKMNKAEGVDRVRNEHLKSAGALVPVWALLFTLLLRMGNYPMQWRHCILKLIYKGKGDPTDPSSWRGISIKSVPGKLMSALVASRLYTYLNRTSIIPPEQHGFVAGRSTLTALKVLFAAIRGRLAVPRRPLYIVFVDFKAAFDTVSREAILGKLSEAGVKGDIMHLLVAMLQSNHIAMDDGVRRHETFAQVTGLPQGDTISSLLFVASLWDLPQRLRALVHGIGVLLYADDLAIYGETVAQVNQALKIVAEIAAEVGLMINLNKTKAMKFRRGGRLAAADRIALGDFVVPFVTEFNYLGVILTPSASTFTKHIAERRARAIVNMALIPDLKKISLNTASSLFSLKIAPVAAYGILAIWSHLRLSDLNMLNGIKAIFLKRALGLHKTALNRIAYQIADTPSFIEDLVKTHSLPATAAYREFLAEQELKLAELDPDFYKTPALTCDQWKAPQMSKRHIYCRTSAHGFHHKFCRRQDYHLANTDCLCRLCDQHCAQYHFMECTQSPFHTIEGLAM
jgi:hypothetical protein